MVAILQSYRITLKRRLMTYTNLDMMILMTGCLRKHNLSPRLRSLCGVICGLSS